MYNDILNFEAPAKKFAREFKKPKSNVEIKLRFEGHSVDITESYFWIFNFAYYTGKGYTTLKLEDYHYFSESSQFGTNTRQVKGGSIRAFQENFQQLVQLIKVHLMPLLKEVKQAEFYNIWMLKIVENDEKYQQEKKKQNPNQKDLDKFKRERDEAINHIKDEWVMKVDGGKLWQMNRPATEQGLDFALLPQLFFGINLENPLYELHHDGKSIKEQLDDDIYSVDITQDAKSQVARFMYRFHLWLPTAIKETQITYKIKKATLKQIYTQIQMNINIIKPLLIEIARKSEGFDKGSFYRDFEMENPHFVNLFDTSYSFVRTIGIRNFAPQERGEWQISDLELGENGLYVRETKTISHGKHKGKKGYLAGVVKYCVKCNKIAIKGKCENCDSKEIVDKYEFYQSDDKKISAENFKKIKKKVEKDSDKVIDPKDLKKYPIIELEFSQRRRTEVVSGPQGPQQVPFMKNEIKFMGYAMNIYEIALHRESLKEKNLELLESFISELAVIKDDLLYYVNDLDIKKADEKKQDEKDGKKEKKSEFDTTIIFGPFKGLYEITKPLIPGFSLPKREVKITGHPLESEHQKVETAAIEDLWKVYTIFKKAHGYMQY